ncbi:MAG TPA: radical SAM family heme chaperone HemW [Candidatus Eisenbacteria bacterium]|nr:radical SAM family heme chaperone HemW [Candidatus Eisenbacteria bacterium]
MTVQYGLYLHLPYCRSVCPYCAFSKEALHKAEPRRLLDGLRREWELAREEDPVWIRTRPRTVFFGGGTPTALDPGTLADLFRWMRASFDLGDVREWTVEANPEGLTDEKIAMLLEAGADRLSLGVQSLEPAVLRALGRIHTPERSLDALERASRGGFRNVSADLMVAVPGETERGIREAVRTLADRGIVHLSVYSLQVEEGTPFAAKVARGAVHPLGEDDAAERYAWVAEEMDAAGFRHYEVSNWARPGFESRHNQGYWTRRPYLGLGPGAHSFDGRSRWRNEEDVTRYYERLESGSLPREERAALTPRDAATETIFLALRRARGLRHGRARSLTGACLDTWARWAADAGAVRLDPPGRIRPTERGLLTSHEISSDLLSRMDAAGRP